MKLLEDSGRLALVEIDSIVWHMASEEYHAMRDKPFHFWPHNLKRINPQPHSCSRCIHRPFQFQDTKRRTCIPTIPPCPSWGCTRAAPYYDNSDCPAGEWS